MFAGEAAERGSGRVAQAKKRAMTERKDRECAWKEDGGVLYLYVRGHGVIDKAATRAVVSKTPKKLRPTNRLI